METNTAISRPPLALFVLSAISALCGAAALWSDVTVLEPLQLRWNASAEEPFPVWVRLLWPLAVAVTPFAYRSGLFGVCLYSFVSLSIQGSEAAAKSLLTDGALDWTLALIAISFLLGKRSRGESLIQLYRHPAFICLLAVVIWVGLTLAAASLQGELGIPRPYRRPVLWLHCLAMFAMGVETLTTNERRVALVAFIAFCLVWRICATKDSVWLEGHVASYLVLLLPWTLFAATQPVTSLRRWLLAAYCGLAVAVTAVFLAGGGYLVAITLERFSLIPLVATVTIIGIALAMVPPRWLPAIFISAVSLVFIASVILIENRAAALGLAAVMTMAVVLAPPSWTLRIVMAGLMLGVLIACANYAPLVERFKGSMVEGGSGQERLEIWRIAWESSGSNRLLGIGPGQFPHIVRDYNPALSSRLDTHNSWLEMLAETGWPGVILFSTFWLLIVAISIRLSLGRFRNQSSETVASSLQPDISKVQWVQRASLAFVAAYAVIGVFGSRHNLPLAYLLAAIPISVDFSTSRGNIHSRRAQSDAAR